MKKLKNVILLSLIALAGLTFISANTTSSDSNHEYVTVDTDPGAPGYYTAEVNMKYRRNRHKVDRIYFSVRGTFDQTVTLQYKCVGDATWTIYATYTAVTRVAIDDNGDGVVWRAGVVDAAAYTSGSSTFGFDW